MDDGEGLVSVGASLIGSAEFLADEVDGAAEVFELVFGVAAEDFQGEGEARDGFPEADDGKAEVALPAGGAIERVEGFLVAQVVKCPGDAGDGLREVFQFGVGLGEDVVGLVNGCFIELAFSGMFGRGYSSCFWFVGPRVSSLPRPRCT